MTTAALTNEQIITQALSEYTPVVVGDAQISPDEKIKEIAALCKEVQISGTEDAANYKLAKNYATRLTKIRTGIEGKRKELKAVALEYGRAVDAEAKRLTALVEPIERDMKAKVDAIDKAIEQAKRAEELRRHNLLLENGWTFTGAWYLCGILNIAPQQLHEATAEKLTEWEAAGQAEMKRQAAEAERKRKEDEDRKAEIAKLELLRKEAAEKANLPFENGKLGRANIEDSIPGLKKPEHNETDIVTVSSVEQGKNIAHELAKEVHPDILGEATDMNPNPSPYNKGFEACRAKVLALLADPTPRKRSEFIEAIKKLEA